MAGAIEAGGVDAAVVDLAVRVAQVLAHRDGIVEGVLELIAQRALLGGVLVEARLADEEVLRDAPARLAVQRAAPGQEAQHGAAVVLLEIRQQRQRSAGAGPVRQRWRDEIAVVLDVLDRGVAVAPQRHHAVQPFAFFIDRAGQVGLDLLALVVAVADADLARGLGLRTLADLVQDAAHGALAVQHAGRPLQHLDALQRIGIGTGVVVEADGIEQAIQVLGGIGATDLDRIAAVVHAEGGGGDASGITHRLLHRLRALQFHAVARDHRDRLRRFHQRRVGLGGGDGAPGHEALHRAGRGFIHLGRRHGDRGQFHLLLRLLGQRRGDRPAPIINIAAPTD